METDERVLMDVEVFEDRTGSSRCDEGFLKLRRLVLRNRYSDGSASEPYPCDVLERPGSDAVVSVLYDFVEGQARVLLREAPRPPIHLRKDKSFVHPDPRTYLTILEVVAGLVEADDPPGDAGLARRAAAEAREEAGLELEEHVFSSLGGETFASPGTTDEKLFFCVARVPLEERAAPTGDGSVMEEWSRVHLIELGEALTMCRDGRIPDMKTELALARLSDDIGFIPVRGKFIWELQPDVDGPSSLDAIRKAWEDSLAAGSGSRG